MSTAYVWTLMIFFAVVRVFRRLIKSSASYLGSAQVDQAPPHVVYAWFKFTWAQGNQIDTLQWLTSFTEKLAADIGIHSGDVVVHPEARNEYTQLLARCYLKLGAWEVALTENWVAVRVLESELYLDLCLAILFLTRSSIFFWTFRTNRSTFSSRTRRPRSWTQSGTRLGTLGLSPTLKSSNILKGKRTLSTRTCLLPTLFPLSTVRLILPGTVVPFLVVLFRWQLISWQTGFFRSIALSKGNSLQDSLRLLTLWFKHGYHDAVNLAISQGAASISIDVWLEVIPQVSRLSGV